MIDSYEEEREWRVQSSEFARGCPQRGERGRLMKIFTLAIKSSVVWKRKNDKNPFVLLLTYC